MDRIWQWAWDRYGASYSWVIWVATFAVLLPGDLVWSLLVVAFEKSSHYVEATVVTVIAVVVLSFVVVLRGSRRFRLAQAWAAGRELDRAGALQDTYTWTRAAGVRATGFRTVWVAVLLMVVGVIAGAGQISPVASKTQLVSAVARSSNQVGGAWAVMLPMSQ
jgi:adenylate cyclase